MNTITSSDISKLINLILNDNDYLLTFQCQPETQALAKTIITYRNSGYSDPDGLDKVLDALIVQEKQIKYFMETDDVFIELTSEILGGVEESIKRINTFKDAEKNTVNMNKLTL